MPATFPQETMNTIPAGADKAKAFTALREAITREATEESSASESLLAKSIPTNLPPRVPSRPDQVRISDRYTIPEEAKESIQALIDRGLEIGVIVYPDGANFDVIQEVAFEESKESATSIVINKQMWEKLDGRAIEIETGIYILGVGPTESTEGEVTASYKRESNGHLLLVVTGEHGETRGVIVHPRDEFRRTGSESDLYDLQIDLEAEGLGVISGLIRHRPEVRVMQIRDDTYDVYSSNHHESLGEDDWAKLDSYAEGVATAENLFGFEPGKKVLNIMVQDSAEANASFYERTLDTVRLQDEALKDWTPKVLEITGAHETIHLLDRALSPEPGGQLSDGEAFRAFFDALTPRDDGSRHPFFEKIAESNLTPDDTGELGHPEKNPAELFASLLNAVTQPERLAVMIQEDRDFARTLAAGMQAVKVELERSRASQVLPKDAPVLQRIDALVELAERKISER